MPAGPALDGDLEDEILDSLPPVALADRHRAKLEDAGQPAQGLVPNAAVEQPSSLSWLMPVKVSAVWPHQSQSSQRSLAGIFWVAACSAAEHEMAADSKQEVALAAGIPVHDGHEANVDCAVKATRIAPAKPVVLSWLMPVKASVIWQHLSRSSLKSLTDISEIAACSAAEHEIAADSTLGVALTAGIPEQESNEAGAGAAVKATRKAPAKQARCFAVLEAVVSSDCVALGGAKELLVIIQLLAMAACFLAQLPRTRVWSSSNDASLGRRGSTWCCLCFAAPAAALAVGTCTPPTAAMTCA